MFVSSCNSFLFREGGGGRILVVCFEVVVGGGGGVDVVAVVVVVVVVNSFRMAVQIIECSEGYPDGIAVNACFRGSVH